MMPYIVGFATLCAIGAAFGTVVAKAAQRFGSRTIAACWLIASFALGSVWAFQAVRLQRALGRGPERASAPGLYALFIVTALVVLSAPAFGVWRRHRGATPMLTYPHMLAASAGWTIVGFVLATLIAALLDIAGVNFLPIH